MRLRSIVAAVMGGTHTVSVVSNNCTRCFEPESRWSQEDLFTCPGLIKMGTCKRSEPWIEWPHFAAITVTVTPEWCQGQTYVTLSGQTTQSAATTEETSDLPTCSTVSLTSTTFKAPSSTLPPPYPSASPGTTPSLSSLAQPSSNTPSTPGSSFTSTATGSAFPSSPIPILKTTPGVGSAKTCSEAQTTPQFVSDASRTTSYIPSVRSGSSVSTAGSLPGVTTSTPSVSGNSTISSMAPSSSSFNLWNSWVPGPQSSTASYAWTTTSVPTIFSSDAGARPLVGFVHLYCAIAATLAAIISM